MGYLCIPAPLTVMMLRLDLRAVKAFGKPHESDCGEVALMVGNIFRDGCMEYATALQASGKIIFNRRACLTATPGFQDSHQCSAG